LFYAQRQIEARRHTSEINEPYKGYSKVFFSSFNFIITKNKMNILDYEEAAQVEEQLLNVPLPT